MTAALAVTIYVLRIDNEDMPTVVIEVPNGYCGDVVVFWGENTPEVEESASFLSYNLRLTRPDGALLVNLPAPHQKATLQFLYASDERSFYRNPIVRSKEFSEGSTLGNTMSFDAFTLTSPDQCSGQKTLTFDDIQALDGALP